MCRDHGRQVEPTPPPAGLSRVAGKPLILRSEDGQLSPDRPMARRHDPVAKRRPDSAAFRPQPSIQPDRDGIGRRADGSGGDPDAMQPREVQTLAGPGPDARGTAAPRAVRARDGGSSAQPVTSPIPAEGNGGCASPAQEGEHGVLAAEASMAPAIRRLDALLQAISMRRTLNSSIMKNTSDSHTRAPANAPPIAPRIVARLVLPRITPIPKPDPRPIELPTATERVSIRISC